MLGGFLRFSPAAAAARCSALNAQLLRCRSSYTTNAAVEPCKAAILVIGDEVLSGAITDANTPWLAKRLHSRGVDLTRVECVPDDDAEIGEAALRLRARVGPNGFVLTSGGIGPTHDDKTYAALASAFGVCLELHQPTVERMQEHYTQRGVELNEARLRMALLPAPAEVLFSPGLWVPLVNLQGVFILPGIPRLLQTMIQTHIGRFTGPSFHEDALYTQMGEGDLAVKLGAIQVAHPGARIGSYPNTDFGDGRYKVKISVESRSPAALAQALEAVEEQLETFRL